MTLSPFEADDWTGGVPSRSHVLLSSERQDWRTPGWFVDMVREVGPIALDPATAIDNPTGAARYFAQNGPALDDLGAFRPFGYWGPCGLRGEWDAPAHRGLTFCNPPYGAHLSGPVEPDYQIMRKGKLIGVGRGWAQKIASHCGETIALVPVRTDAEWWNAMADWADLILFWRSSTRGARISFVNPDTGKPQQGSNLASTVFYRAPIYEAGEGRHRFRAVFGSHGRLIHGGSGAR